LDLSLVIPACNEEQRIGETLIAYAKDLRASGIDFEIITEMDGCTDRTAQVVTRLGCLYPEIRGLEFEDKLGKGGGLVKGFEAARGNYVGFVDADGPVRPENLMKLLAEVRNGTDFAIASRRAKGAKALYRTRRRQVLSRCFNLLVRMMFALPYKDTQCGAKVMKRDAIEKMTQDIHVNGFAFDVGLIYAARKNGLSIKEVGVNWEDKTGSKVDITHTIFDMLISVIKLRIFFSPFKSLLTHNGRRSDDSAEWANWLD
jgi:glycosyltransferase involved in cell wall biosynthesis